MAGRRAAGGGGGVAYGTQTTRVSSRIPINKWSVYVVTCGLRAFNYWRVALCWADTSVAPDCDLNHVDDIHRWLAMLYITIAASREGDILRSLG